MKQTTLVENHEHLLAVNRIYRKKTGREEFCFFDVQEMIEEAKDFISILDESVRQEKFLIKETKELLEKFKSYGYEL